MNKFRDYKTKRKLKEFCEDIQLNLQHANKENEYLQAEIVGLERRNAELKLENERLKIRITSCAF